MIRFTDLSLFLTPFYWKYWTNRWCKDCDVFARWVWLTWYIQAHTIRGCFMLWAPCIWPPEHCKAFAIKV